LKYHMTIMTTNLKVKINKLNIYNNMINLLIN